MKRYWTALDEEVAEKVMGWTMVRLSDPGYEHFWPAWPRETRMRLAWLAECPSDACCKVEAPPGTGANGFWEPHWIPRFSEDMNQAVKVLEALRSRHARSMIFEIQGGAWRCVVQAPGGRQVAVDDASPAVAIAKAAVQFCAEGVR